MKQTILQHIFERYQFLSADEFKSYFNENIEKLLEAEKKALNDWFYKGYAEGINIGRYSSIGKDK